MKNIYEILDMHGYINHSVNGYCAYFDPKNNTFEILEAFDTDSEDYYRKYEKHNKTKVYPMPFESECKKGVWKIFYQILTDEETATAQAFDGTGGFFQYMYETGLITRYNEARDMMITSVLQNIEAECGTNMDLTQLTKF